MKDSVKDELGNGFKWRKQKVVASNRHQNPPFLTPNGQPNRPNSNVFINNNPLRHNSISNPCCKQILKQAIIMAPRDGSVDHTGTPEPVEKGIATLNTLR